MIPLVGAVRPWQAIFLAVGLPGVPLALLLFSVREPERRGAGAGAVRIPAHVTLAYMRRNKWTLICHTLGFALISLRTYAGGSWVPTFFVRTYGWTSARIGIWSGIIVMIAGSLGILAGGWWADRLASRGCRDSKMRVALYALLLSVPPGVLMMLAPNGTLSILLYIPTVFLTSAPFGVAPAAIQEMMPNPMRGQASAVYLFVNSMAGLGIGPTAVAVLTDYAFHDDRAVGSALMIVSLLSSAAATALLWRGLRHFVHTMDHLPEWQAPG